MLYPRNPLTPGSKQALVRRLLLACVLLQAGIAARADYLPDAYAFAVVPQLDPRTLHARWRPVLAYLEQATGYRFSLRSSADIETFERRLNSGDYDFVYASPTQFLTAARLQDYRAILRDGQQALQGIVVVGRDSELERVEQLQGLEAAFPTASAFGATRLVREDLRTSFGVTLQPRYVRGHDSVYLQVATGGFRVGGGVVSTYLQQSAAVRERLRVIHRTQAVKPHPIAAHARVNAGVVSGVVRAFMALSRTSDGKALLDAIAMAAPVTTSTAEYRGLEHYVETAAAGPASR